MFEDDHVGAVLKSILSVPFCLFASTLLFALHPSQCIVDSLWLNLLHLHDCKRLHMCQKTTITSNEQCLADIEQKLNCDFEHCSVLAFPVLNLAAALALVGLRC